MQKLEINPLAEQELEHAVDFYNSRSPGLGNDFLDEFQKALSLISLFPLAWPEQTKQTRRILLHRFPFAVFYRIGEDSIQIIAIVHQNRNPDYWKDRI